MIAPSPKRAYVTPEAVPVMPRHVRLHFDKIRDRYVVLAPEKIYWPDEISIEIINLCDGKRSVAEIASVLAADYTASEDVILKDVMEFVQEWSDRLLMKI